MRTHLIRSVIVVVVSLNLAACGGSTDKGLGPTSSVSEPVAAFPSPVPGGMPVPDPSAMLPVAGQERLMGSSTATPAAGEGATQIRDATATYEGTMSDERVSGTRTVSFNLDGRSDGSGTLWGTSIIRNEGGSWSGTWTGIMSKDGTYRYYFEDFVGAGAYEGLTYHRNSLSEGAPGEAVPGDVMQTSGWLEAVDGHKPQPSPGQTDSGIIPVSGFATFKSSGREWVFRNEMTDPRISKPIATTIVADPLREDRSTDYAVTFRIGSAGTAWVCSGGIGSRGAGGAEHQSYCVAKGTGPNQGLVYHTQWHFFEPFGPSTRIAATGWIE